MSCENNQPQNDQLVIQIETNEKISQNDPENKTDELDLDDILKKDGRKRSKSK